MGDEGAGLPVKRWLPMGQRGQVLLVDSITQLEIGDTGAVVVTGSHGGRSAAAYALEHPMKLVVFNDAGVGKDGAGVVALALLQARGHAAAAVAHDSARIGDAQDAWDHGVLSYVNEQAVALGLAPGLAVHEALRAVLKRRGPAEAGP